MSLDSALEQIVTILDRAKHEALAVVHSLPRDDTKTAPPAQDWMTATQLAEYWQLCNKDGEPTTAGILKWAKRRPDEFPLPHAYMGDIIRFHREEADRWAREEAERRRIENERKRIKLTK